MSGGTFLYPNVTSLPKTGAASPAERNRDPGLKGKDSDFGKLLDNTLQNEGLSRDLGQIRQPLKLSAHATQRVHDRKISMDPEMMAKINDAIDKAEAKGVEETLVLTQDAAWIVSVKNRTVITAMDRNSMNGNVFTNIDGAVIV